MLETDFGILRVVDQGFDGAEFIDMDTISRDLGFNV